jgi:hypothetical protein
MPWYWTPVLVIANRPEYQSLIKTLNLLYDAPLIRYHLVKKDKWYLQKIHIIKLRTLNRHCQ